jgi:hypothetical protein
LACGKKNLKQKVSNSRLQFHKSKLTNSFLSFAPGFVAFGTGKAGGVPSASLAALCKLPASWGAQAIGGIGRLTLV